MGNVIDLAAKRRAKAMQALGASGTVPRLELAIRELEDTLRDPVVRHGRLRPVLESELGAIRSDVAEGRFDEAAERTERLAARLAPASARSG